MAWTNVARAAAAATRRAHAHGRTQRAHGRTQRAHRARATFKPSTKAKQRVARAGERNVIQALRARQRRGTGGTHAVDVMLRRRGHLHGVEVKTLVDNKNNKITMHKSSLARKKTWARANHARLHTVVVDRRTRAPKMYYRKGVGSFRLSSLRAVSSAAHLRRLMGV